MTETTLRDCRILVVEDEYMLADELQIELSDHGATVLGPVALLEDAMEHCSTVSTISMRDPRRELGRQNGLSRCRLAREAGGAIRVHNGLRWLRHPASVRTHCPVREAG
jgi:DNA-binding response OmpR family regulator